MKNKAFTLIELLVIISIIGLLSSVTIVQLSNAKSLARDARRLADLNTIKKALEMYRIEKGGYPSTSKLNNSYWPCGGGQPMEDWIPDLVPNYISKLPHDPRDPSTCRLDYNYKSDGIDYKLIAKGPEDCARIERKYPNLIDRPKRACGTPSYPAGEGEAFGYWTDGVINWLPAEQ